MKKGKKIISNWMNNTPIKKKMIISYMAIVSIAVIAVAFIMFTIISRRYEEQLLYSASQSFSQAEEFLNYRASSALYASNLLQVDNQVQEILSRSEKDIKDNLIQQNRDMIYTENFIYSLCNSTDIFQISIYVPDYLMYVDQEVIFRNLNVFKVTKEYERLIEAGNIGIWLPPEEIYSADTSKWVKVVSFLRTVKNRSDLNKIIGVQRVSIRYEDLNSIIEKSNITESGIICLQNKDSELIACSNEELYESLEAEIAPLIEKNINGISWKKIKIDSKNYLVNIETIKSTDWTMIAMIPEKELFKDNRYILISTLIVLTFVLTFSIIFTLLFSRMMTKRISMLAMKMENLDDGVPELADEDMGDDEIGLLFESFKSMSERINELIKKQYENGKAVKQAELRALQAQINPHFLYNTLDLINWEALDIGADSIVEISHSLAKFYKLSLNKGKEISTIKDEIDHIKHYVQIQNYRFEGRIVLQVDIPENLYNYEIPHIVLQPLVENSIIHGMAEMESEEKLYIYITGRVDGSDIVLEAEDSGCGMPEEKSEIILEADTVNMDAGYGVSNIHLRFKLCYGEKYGLTYSGNRWGGVTVALRLPREGEV